jgi:glycosyltransferase involved in cell wall biosynthesis
LHSKKRLFLLGDINSIHLKKWILELYENFDLAVFSFNSLTDQDLLNQCSENDIKLFTPSNKKNNKLSYFFRLNALKKAYRSFEPDIVHAHYATSYGFFGAQLKAKNYIVSVWGSDVFDFPRKSSVHKSLIKYVFGKAKAILSTSNVMAQEIQLYTEKKIHVTPFGIEVDKFVPKAKTSDKFIVGTVKTLEKIYGIDYLIEAFSEFNKHYPNSECHIYGKGSMENELKTLALKLNIIDSVKFMGYVNHDKVPGILNTFDVFCALSREESFGVAVLEASSCEIPVIVNRIGGLKEVVKDGITGFVLDASDSSQVADKILFLANSKEECQRLGEMGRQYVEKNYSWEKSAEIINEIYKNI